MSRSSWVRIPAPYTGWTFFDGEVFADGEQLQEDVLECFVHRPQLKNLHSE